MKKVRLVDIAEELGVSAVTVHNALSGNKGVGEELRERITRTAQRMGYYVPAQQKTESQPIRKICMLISERFLAEYTTYYWKVYQEIAMAAVEYGCMVPAEILKHEQEDNNILPQMLIKGMIDGMIVLGEVNASYLRELKKEIKVPLVYMDFYDRDLADDAVIADNFYGMYRMTQYLLDKGFRKLAFVGSIHATSSIMDRYCGFYRAMLAYGESPEKQWVLEDRDSIGNIHIDLPEKLPEAFVCNCDLTAGTVIRLLEEKGVKVPEDVSVVGFDNYSEPGFQNQKITTYEVDTRKMSRLALMKVLRKIEDPQERHSLEVVTGSVIEKESVRING